MQLIISCCLRRDKGKIKKLVNVKKKMDNYQKITIRKRDGPAREIARKGTESRGFRGIKPVCALDLFHGQLDRRKCPVRTAGNRNRPRDSGKPDFLF